MATLEPPRRTSLDASPRPMRLVPQEPLDWLIVGGGLHGVHAAVRLAASAARPSFRIMDPGQTLLEAWRRKSAATGMQCLRSPSMHHLGLGPFDLRRFFETNAKALGVAKPYSRPYDRPALQLFNAHCESLVQTYGLEDLHLQAEASAIDLAPGGVEVHTKCGATVSCQRVLLALGSPALRWPAWAPKGHPRVMHVLGERWPSAEEGAHVVVVGGGISAVQVALRLSKRASRVTLVSRHPMRKHTFDADPGWLGPKKMRGFLKETSWQKRRAMIDAARRSGSIPAGLNRQLQRARFADRVALVQGEIVALRDSEDALRCQLASGEWLSASEIVIATGYRSGAMPPIAADLAARYGLPLAPCGSPIVGRDLCWHPRVVVMGELAELRLGPTARNISGARRAGDRISELAQALIQKS